MPYARELQNQLSSSVETQLWNQGFFRPSTYPIEALELQSRKFDGAVVVATADDRVISRGREDAAVRDNLLFEYGMFVAVFGRRRALLMVEGAAEMRLPSDFGGLTVVPFEASENLPAAIGPAANQVREVAEEWRDEPFPPDTVTRLNRLAQWTLDELRERSGVGPHLGLHVFLLDERSTPSELVRVARARSSPKPPRPWPPFQEGIGIVGTCWSTGGAVFADLTDGRHATATEPDWSALGPLQRSGMDYAMLETSRKRYKCVGAVPITSLSSGFIGCVSYNLGVASDVDSSALTTAAVESVFDSCAELIAIVLGR